MLFVTCIALILDVLGGHDSMSALLVGADSKGDIFCRCVLRAAIHHRHHTRYLVHVLNVWTE